MKGIKFLGLAVILIMALMLPSVAYAGKPDVNPHATNVEIVKRMSVRGVPLPYGGGGPVGTPAATGLLGEKVSGTRYAIIVGISDYAGTESDLIYADDDAITMKDTLVEHYGFAGENVQSLVDANATRGGILDAIASLAAEATEGDEVVFYFAGHGARGRADDNDWEAVDEGIVPYECTPETVIWDGELAEAFRGFKTDRIVFIFDSCLAGGMTDLEADGRIILMASTENGYAAEAYPEQWPYHGLFTYFLVVAGMQDGYADSNPEDGSVTAEEAFDYSKAALVELSRRTPILMQTPAISDLFLNDLLF